MNDAAGKTTSSSLVVAEKRPPRPGGCVGIFFQLFDWNRRFAKKKLFSRKLLPPARAKQASKKFGGDEKMPKAKLLLIADENSGGFPNAKKNGLRGVDDDLKSQKHEMRAPGLVARLMGLDSMPAVHREKPRKALLSETHDDKDEKFVRKQNGSEKEDLSVEKGSMKHESRPQKLQKTGPSERRAVTRFGAEALQFKNVLSRSRKHHPKLVSPVKSPRIISGKSASRLIDAATRILEPGLQAKSRAKCALTYSNYTCPNLSDEVMTEGKSELSPELSKQSGNYASAVQSLRGQSSCKNCGNLLDVVDLRPNVEERPSVYATSCFVNASSEGSGSGSSRPPISSAEEERNIAFQKSWEQPTAVIAQAKDNVQNRREPVADRKPPSRDGQAEWHLTSQQCQPQKDASSSCAFKCRSQTQSQMSLGKDGIPPKSKLSNLQSRRVSSAVNAVNEPKDFVALNRSLSNRTRPRTPAKVGNCKLETERKSFSRQDNSLSQPRTLVRKRRTVNVGRQVVNTGFMSSTSGNQRNAGCGLMSGKEMAHNASSMNQSCVKSKLTNQGVGNTVQRKNTDVVSFTFSSPMKHKNGVLNSKEMKEKSNESDPLSDNNSQQKKLMQGENYGKSSFLKKLPLRGDALGALLEQKLKELTYQAEDELGGNPPKRSTAVILQELISALNGEQPISWDDRTVGIDQKDNSCYGMRKPSDHAFSNCRMFNTDVICQAEAMMEGTSVGFSYDGDHFSPGSVLEASFSNDSCFSSSLDEISGHRLHLDPMDYSYDQQPHLEPDLDLLDSATSLDKGGTGTEVLTDLVNHISGIIYGINLAGAGLTGSKLRHAKEVILNAELCFGSSTLHNSDGMNDFLVGPFLLDKLENLAGGTRADSSFFLNFEEPKEGNQLRAFLFDCVIEYLNSRYSQYFKSGFRAWRRLPFCMNTEMLSCEVDEEIRRWTDLAGKLPDEIIESEMSHSLGKWTEFEIEAFETYAEIDGDILQILVDEIVMDLCQCRLCIS